MAKGRKTYKKLRNFTISLIILVLGAVLFPFFLKGPDQQALISPDKLKLPEIKLLKKPPQDARRIPTPTGANVKKKKNVIYKWKDKHGVIHFTDYPNPNGPSEEIAAVPKRKPGEESKSPQKKLPDTATDADSPSSLPFPMTISPSRVKKLKQDAEKIREVLEQRYEDLALDQEN